MKTFLLKFTGFTILMLIMWIALLCISILLSIRACGNNQLDDSYHSVIIGDSHTMWSIDDRKIDGLKNLSLNAEGYKYSYLKLKRLLETNDNIKRVYVGFSYHNLSNYYDSFISGEQFKFFIERYLSILSLQDYTEIFINNPGAIIEITKRIITNGLKAGLQNRCTLVEGFPIKQMEQTFDYDSLKRRIDEQFFIDNEVRSISSSNHHYLKLIIELCRKNNVEVIMVNTPLHKDYKRLVPSFFIEAYSQFLKKYDLNVYSFEDLNLDDNYFLPDGDHTNYSGAIESTMTFKAYHENL